MPIIGNNSSAGKKPTTPTIGTATADNGSGSISFTPSSYIGKNTITYTAISNPSNITGTSASSPITVSGLNNGTTYTFTVLGTTNYGVLSEASSSSSGITPIEPSDFESIQTFNSSYAQSVTFSSIPQTYKHLQIRVNGRSSDGNSEGSFIIIINSDETQKYNDTNMNLKYEGGFASSVGGSVNNYALYNQSLPAEAGRAGRSGFVIVDFYDYKDTSKYKSMSSRHGIAIGQQQNSAVRQNHMLYKSTNTITSITIKCGNGANFFNTQIALYGIKG